ncbi:MAG: class I SAM-dependent methyltransferase [bacterium]
MNNNSIKPSPLVQNFSNNTPTGKALEIGFGYGDNAIFLAQQGFSVVAVDINKEMVENLKERSMQYAVDLEIIKNDIRNFLIKDNEYTFISALNCLNFLSKEEFFNIMEKIKNGLKNDGVCVIALFTVDDEMCEEVSRKTNGKFDDDNGKKWFFLKSGELKELFENDFLILFYKEVIIDDNGHVGKELPHRHAVARIVAKKRSAIV